MKKHKEDKPPKGGWLGPGGNTTGLPPLRIARKSKKGKWLWEDQRLSKKDKRTHKRFQKAMAKADKKGKWSFTW